MDLKESSNEGDFLIIQTSLNCNQKCSFCSYPGEDKELSALDIKNIILESKGKVNTIIFSGGEPTLRADLLELISFSIDQGLKPRIISNGQFFSDVSFAKKIVSLKIDNITISLQSSIESIHDSLTNTKGSFQKTIEGIKNLISFKCVPSIMTTINKLNYKTLPDFSFFLNKTFPEINSLILILVDSVGRAKKNSKVLVSLSEIQEPLIRTLNFLDKKNYKVDVEGVAFCYLNEYVRYSTEFNQSKRNISYYIYELSKGKTVGGKFSDKLKLLYVQVNSCKYCNLKKICPGINKNYLEFFGDKDIFPIFDSFLEER